MTSPSTPVAPARSGSGRWTRRPVLAAGVAGVLALSLGLGTDAWAATPAVTGTTLTSSVAAPAAPTSCPSVVAGWSTRRLAAETTVVSAEMTDLPAASAALDDGAGGVILFGSAPSNLAADIHHAVDGSPLPTSGSANGPLVMTDEEGGEIQRVQNLVGSLPWARTDAQTLSPTALTDRVTSVARRMRSLGITMDLAPVLDLNDGPGPDATHPDGLRSFSNTPSVAGRYGLAFMNGLQDGGVIATAKHFPGLGTATDNTDNGPATIDSLSHLQRRDLHPFETAISHHVPAIMVSNAMISGGVRRPVALVQSVVTDLLQDQLHFHGLVVTDSLTAGAITDAGYSAPAAAVAALRAGVDLTLDGSSTGAGDASRWSAVVHGITSAVAGGHLSESRLRDAAAHVAAAQGLC